MKVLKTEFLEGVTVIFEGDEEKAKIIYQTLLEYHKYDRDIRIEIEEKVQPEFKNLKDFFEIHEYKWTYDELQKKLLKRNTNV